MLMQDILCDYSASLQQKAILFPLLMGEEGTSNHFDYV